MAQIVQNLLDHIQPQTGGFPPETAVLPGEKQVENAGKVLRRNAAARILYAQHNVRRRVICLDHNGASASLYFKAFVKS